MAGNACLTTRPTMPSVGEPVRPGPPAGFALRRRADPPLLSAGAFKPPHPQDVPAALARATMLAMQPPRRPVLVSLPMDDWAATADVEAGRRRLLEVPIDEAGATHW